MSIIFCDCKEKCTKFCDSVSILFSSISSEQRALVTKNKETLERYKGLVQSNYKEPTKGNFDDSTKEVLAELQTEENSESEEEC